MGKKPLKLKNGQDVVRHILSHPSLKDSRWNGDHLTADGPTGRITACNSRYEYPKHLRRKIIAQLTIIGLGIAAILWIVII